MKLELMDWATDDAEDDHENYILFADEEPDEDTDEELKCLDSILGVTENALHKQQDRLELIQVLQFNFSPFFCIFSLLLIENSLTPEFCQFEKNAFFKFFFQRIIFLGIFIKSI